MAVAADARQLIHAQPARAHYPACYCRRQCLGRFCQCRFKSQALLDEKAVIAAMACVDLNPIRARMTETPEASGHTAIRRRLRQLKAFDSDAAPEPEPLCPFAGNTCEAMPDGLACPLAGYVGLVEGMTGSCIRTMRGAILAHVPPLLERLHIAPERWTTLTPAFEAALPA